MLPGIGQKFVVGGCVGGGSWWWVVCKPILVCNFNFGQAEEKGEAKLCDWAPLRAQIIYIDILLLS